MEFSNKRILYAVKGSDGNLLLTGTEPIYVRQYTGVFSSITRTLTLLDGDGNTTIPGSLNVSKNMTVAGSGNFNNINIAGDISQQGTQNSRTLRYYASDIRCGGSFGAASLNMARVHDGYIDYYVNGDTNSYVRFKLKYNDIGVYSIYLYPTSHTGYSLSSGNASVEDAFGFPVDLLVFDNKAPDDYKMIAGSVGKKVIVVNANNNITVYLDINGHTEDDDSSDNEKLMLEGGKVATFINIIEFMRPEIESSADGAGWMMCGEYDNDWNYIWK